MEPERGIINDHLFVQTVSCPLKHAFITESGLFSGKRPVYRQRNKLHLRDALAVCFENTRHTSDDIESAIDQTKNWLQDEKSAICGAVLRSENQLTRIPVLVKNGNRLTIVQVHGKLRKRTAPTILSDPAGNKSISGYLLKAAWRWYLVKKLYPHNPVDAKFYFPDKNFKSTVEGINRFKNHDQNDEVHENLIRLFNSVDATNATKNFHDKLPELIVHTAFSGLSVAGAVNLIQSEEFNQIKESVGIHDGCKGCMHRRETNEQQGCWNLHFNTGNIRHSNHHIYELIGHGNDRGSGNGIYFQEELNIPEGVNTFEKIKKTGDSVITVQQRKYLQLLKLKEKKVPSLWIKPSLNILEKLPRPLHFIDFEAATYALPMKKGSGCYDPVYFQFSCHSLHNDGTLTHTAWLDENTGSENLHGDFSDQLYAIPAIVEGTIVQYSPFEKQAINNLIREFKRCGDDFRLKNLLAIRGSGNNQKFERFFDLSKFIRIGYYNRFMEEGLSLKQILGSVMKWERSSGRNLEIFEKPSSDEMVEILRSENPYSVIQQKNTSIVDGASAMNAWLALKNGLLDVKEKEDILRILKKYCALDSFALYIIFMHLVKVFELSVKEEVILFDSI